MPTRFNTVEILEVVGSTIRFKALLRDGLFTTPGFCLMVLYDAARARGVKTPLTRAMERADESCYASRFIRAIGIGDRNKGAVTYTVELTATAWAAGLVPGAKFQTAAYDI